MNKLSPRRGRAALIAKVSCLLALVACVCALSLTNAIADMSVIDCGVPVLSMHAPWEATSKADIFEAYRGYRAFLKLA